MTINPNRPDWYIRWLAHQERATKRAEAAAHFVLLFVVGLIAVLGLVHIFLGCATGALLCAAFPPVLRIVDHSPRSSPLIARAERLWPDNKRNQHEWMRAVAVVRATTRGWLLERRQGRCA